jgi:FkbM family methyltransferase
MKFIKRLIVGLIHRCGYDLYRIQKETASSLLGLHSLGIRTVIDIGANRGQFAQRVIDQFPAARFFCFEPLPDAFQELERWATQAHPGKFTLFNVALGEKEGAVTLFSPLEHNDASSLLESTDMQVSLYPVVKKQRRIDAQMTTLDAALTGRTQELTPNILIKIDVEGYEDRVIKGGTAIFPKAAVCIVEICLDELHHGQATFRDIFTLLSNLGYRYGGSLDQVCAADGHPIYINAVFIRDGRTP